jgi:two-component system response regulator MprA
MRLGWTRGVDALAAARVLVVDEDVRSARILARMLREDGFIVELAVDGAAAIGRLSRPLAPDVLVTELQVPHAGGLAIARYARSLQPGLPVVVITGYPELVPQGPGELSPAPTVLIKPLDYDRLSEVLRRVAYPAGAPVITGRSS